MPWKNKKVISKIVIKAILKTP